MKISLRTFFLAISGLVLAPVAWAQTASNVITRVLPAGSVKASISSFVATPSNVNKPITSYQVTFPDGGIGGTLSANGNVVSNGTVIPAGQANLTFEPGAVAGVFVFTYTATETNNGGNPTTSTPASYTLPISPKAFSFGSGFDFSTADNNSSWTNRTFTSNTVTVNTTGYSTSASSPAVEFQVGDRQIGANAAALPTKALYWYTDYSSTANSSTVTYTFDKPLRGFSVVLQDIDASTTGGNNFIDQVQLDGYATTAGTVPMTLSAADFTIRANGVNAYTGSTVPNTVSGTGTGTSNANPADAVIVSFPQSISKLVITYRNTASTASALTQQIIGISSFGWAAATAATNAAPLPVILSSFEAVAKGDAAQLQWTTASEKNNDRFEVERSVTGAAFERVGTVNGHGTTTNPQAYFFTDGVAAAHGRLVYYRLRQVDFDGVSTYSPVRSVSFGSKGAVAVNLSLFPNPTTGAATLDLSKLPIGDYFLTALDLAGRQMLHQKLEGGQVAPLDLRALPNGTFLLKITGAQLNKTLRVVKE